MSFAARITSSLITGFARLVTGVRPEWRGCLPEAKQRVYFANHTSNGDFVLLWCVLPPELRNVTRPVAAADYWLKGKLKRFVGEKVFRAVLIEREAAGRTVDPMAQMTKALDEGASLIIFPEGKRNMGEEPLLPFRSGLYNLALARPDVELVPCWIDNLSRVLPKGEILPLPMLCSVTFGATLQVEQGEERRAFLERAEQAVLALGRHAGYQVIRSASHAG
ncbi:MAG: lysophospholipid acyltransferase family protein [Beijerinckiaceae bacterium]